MDKEPIKSNDSNQPGHNGRTVQRNQIFIRTMMNFDNTKAREDYQRRLKKYSLFLALFPLVFLLMIIGFFYLIMVLLRSHVSVYILGGIFFVILVREISTLIFSLRMRSNILKPLEALQKGVEEIAGGNYGFAIDEKVPSVIGGLFRSFNKMSKELKEGEEVKRRYEENRKELIAGISHDLKTPITSILGYMEGIHEGVANSPEKLDRYLDIIHSNAVYTNQLIDDLFLFSKLDINQMEYDFQKVYVKDYFTDVFVEKKIDLEERGAKVQYEVALSDDLQLSIDPKMIHRVITNLIGNAVKYNDKDQLSLNLSVQADEARSCIEVAIEDNGRGIDAEHIDHIFDVFYRVDKARNKDVGGTGLGLSISKQLVEAHGGEIGATSKVGEGTKIKFTLKGQA